MTPIPWCWIASPASRAPAAGFTQNTHYPDCNEAFAPYKVAGHRHTPEIEQTLSDVAGVPVKVTFVPHLLPVNRGIVSTMYASLCQDVPLEAIHQRVLRSFTKTSRLCASCRWAASPT